MRKKLLLIQPTIKQYRGKSDLSHPNEPLALEIIAGLTPKDWEIQIIDEHIEAIRLEDPEEADLVGLTAYTSTAPRAYEIAEVYKRRGIPVVMGGIHASMLTQEALNFAHTVVTGEVEGIWGEIIADFEAKEMQRVYNGGYPDLKKLPTPRRDLLPSHYRYSAGTIQTGRGCPHNCEFCSVTLFNGFRYRKTPIDEILDALETIPQKIVLFLDDNLIGYGKRDMEYAIKLFQGINERGIDKIFSVQSSFKFAQEKVLKSASESGCRLVNIGIEAEDTAALKEMNKRLNLKLVNNANYEDLFALIHQYGIAIDGNFIYGLDADTPEKIRKRTDFIMDSDLDMMRISPLTPLPGTRLFKKLKQEGRLLYTNFPEDWEHYDLQKVAFKPALMKPDELTDLVRESKALIYSEESIERRFQKTLTVTDDVTAYMVKAFNLGYRHVSRVLGYMD
ncbi:MAG: B12-binding domain-containing radical SAM protein [Desulfobacterales bacterium]|nr:B12-binding domain-containing radical SAM protein [Desulfobacterales bacterium]